ncbi:MAG TPA: hypothetical protein VIU61_09085 [Kofleriaceae bacterium]
MPVLALILAACGGDPEGSGECPTMDVDDAGDLAALAAQRCNVPGSMGASNWYRLAATIPSSSHVVQLELWPNRGAFAGGLVTTGTFQIAGADLDFATCGLCLRALGDKGGANQTEFFATSGTVEVTAVAPTADAPFEATITNATFIEVNADHVAIDDGCVADVARAKVTGTVTIMGGSGGGGGGGGGPGGMGCPATIGD